MAIRSRLRMATASALLMALAVLGGSTLTAGAAAAAAATRFPCAYEAVVRGCHIRPGTFHITPKFYAAGMHWRRWSHTTASGIGHIGGASDGIRLYLWRERNHHFTRLNVTTQGIRERYHWSWNGHRWRI